MSGGPENKLENEFNKNTTSTSQKSLKFVPDVQVNAPNHHSRPQINPSIIELAKAIEKSLFLAVEFCAKRGKSRLGWFFFFCEMGCDRSVKITLRNKVGKRQFT